MVVLFVLFSLVVVIFGISQAIYGTWLSPFNIFLSIWLIIIAFYLLDSILNIWGYLPLSQEAWLLIATSLLSFFMASLSSALFHIAVKRHTLRRGVTARFSSDLQFYLPRLSSIAYLCLFISFIGTAVKWFTLFSVFENPLAMIGEIRKQAVYYGEFSFGILVELLRFFGIAGMFLWGVVIGKDRKTKWWLLAIMNFVTLFFNDLSTGSRGTTFHGFVLFIIAYLLVRFSITGKAPLKNLIASSVATFFVILILFTINRLRGDKVVGVFMTDFLKLSYLYVTGPLPAFDQSLPIMENAVPLQYLLGGVYRSLNSISTSLGFSEIFLLSKEYYPDVFIGPQNFNTVPWLSYIYSDLGIMGVILVPYIIGWFSTHTFFRYKSNPTLLSFTILTLVYTYLVFTPRGTLTSWISFWFLGVFLTTLSLYLQKKLRRARVVSV